MSTQNTPPQPAPATPEKAPSRKEYQRQWIAKKRAALKASRGVEEIRLSIGPRLAGALRSAKPKGLSMRAWLPSLLKEALRLREESGNIKPPSGSPEPFGEDFPLQEAPQPLHQKQPRNSPCACGSGKKFKHCCGVHF